MPSGGAVATACDSDGTRAAWFPDSIFAGRTTNTPMVSTVMAMAAILQAARGLGIS
jgi:hypothetical protein